MIDFNSTFDSRELVESREELEQEILNNYIAWAEDHNDFKDEDAEALKIPDTYEEIEFIEEEAFTMTCEDTIEELEGIVDFIGQLDGYGDFGHGEAIIPQSEFTEYQKDFCEEIGDIPSNLPFYIANNIDWDAVAEDLMMDYTTADYKGQTYLMRA
jgi:hypothetical protein